MMINKIFIDLLEDLKNLKKNKKFFLKIRGRYLVDQAFNKIDGVLSNLETIKPEVVADFVVFLDLARSSGLIGDTLIGKGLEVGFNISQDYHTSLNSFISISNGKNFEFSCDCICKSIPFYLIYYCNEIEKGVGVVGDNVGEFENTNVIVDRTVVSEIPVNYETTFNEDKKEYMKNQVGYILTRIMCMAACEVINSIWEKVNKGEFIFDYRG